MIILVLWDRKFNYYKEQYLGVSNGETQTWSCLIFWSKEDEVQNKGHKCWDLACNVRSNNFPSVHVHHNVGSQKGGTRLNDQSKVSQLLPTWLEIVDLRIIKEIICDFQVHNVANILQGKQISLNSFDIVKFSNY